MKKAVITEYGGPEVLSIIDAEPVKPGKNEVQIDVHYAGVAFADIIMRRGEYLGTPKIPFAPGWDIFGEIIQTGEGVSEYKAGDKVCALTRFGGYSENVCVNRDRVFKVSDSINPAEAAALPLNYITAYQLLTDYAKLNENSRVLLFSAAGGVGTAVLQIASAMNLKVFGVCSSEKTEVVKQFGGIPIDYKSPSYQEDLQKHSPEGYDLVLDPIGGEHLDFSINLVKKGGILAGYGFFSAFKGDEMTGKVGDTIKQFLKLKFLQFNKKVRFYSINPKNYKKNKATMAIILDLYEKGSIKPLIGAEFNLEDVQKAHERLSSGKNSGKIVLRCK
ncbi:MAG: zinc-binding dehydrogenase [Spirochaetia bacterium]|nr:zinc-binding dehydrogenase [Spirochaetia bacterium]